MMYFSLVRHLGDLDQMCTHVGVEEIRIEHNGYYWYLYVCVGCGATVDASEPQPLDDTED